MMGYKFKLGDLPPEAPSFITRVCGFGFYILRFRFGQARRGLVPLTFRSLNSLMRPFARMPRGFCRQAMSGDGAGYKSR